MEFDRERATADFLSRYAEIDGKDVLEIGCGRGRISAYLAGRPSSFAAIDADADKIDEARMTIPDVAFSVGSGEELDFPDESFDVVLFTLSLHHQDAEAALEEARRVVRFGGRIVVLEPVAFSEFTRVRMLFHNEHDHFKQAMEALAGNEDLQEVQKEVFRTEITYDSVDELREEMFAEHDMEHDPELVAKMYVELGEKVSDRPLVVHDDLLIVLLARVG